MRVADDDYGALLWDSEYRFPKNVGPEEIKTDQSLEIHPIKLPAER